MARRSCRIVEINSVKNRHLRELKENFKNCGFAESLMKLEYKKTLKIPQTELCQPKRNEHK